MSAFDDAATLADALNAAGVKTTHDPGRIVPPCVLITPPTLEHDLNCGWTATWKTLVLSPANTARQAWQTLDRLAAQVLDIVDADTVEPSQYSTGDGAPLPCFVITHTSEVDWSPTP
jgi:hypothetical protein